MGEARRWRTLRRAGLTALLAGLCAWALTGSLAGSDTMPASAASIRGVEMVIIYPTGEGWETVAIAMLIEDDGSDFAAASTEARATALARFPGGIEVAPQVAAQFKADGWRFEGNRTWFYNADGRPEDLTGALDALTAGADTWSHAGDADFGFTHGGTATLAPGVCYGEGRDGQNVVGWRDLPGATLAETCYLPAEPVVEFDIQFDTDKAWSTSDSEVVVDLQSVAVHEFGHALGLSHSDDNRAVMYGSYSRETTRRELTGDDIAGFRSLYDRDFPTLTPTATNTAVPSPEPTLPPPGSLDRSGVIPALSRQ